MPANSIIDSYDIGKIAKAREEQRFNVCYSRLGKPTTECWCKILAPIDIPGSTSSLNCPPVPKDPMQPSSFVNVNVELKACNIPSLNINIIDPEVIKILYSAPTFIKKYEFAQEYNVKTNPARK